MIPQVDPVAAEQGVLASLMFRPDYVPVVAGWLCAEDFAWPLHRDMFRAIVTLTERDELPTPERVADQLRAQIELAAAGRWQQRHDMADGELAVRRAEVQYSREVVEFTRTALVGLADLVGEAPLGSPVLFGRHVLDSSVRRELDAAGLQLQQIGRDGLGDTAELLELRRIPMGRLERAYDRVVAADAVWGRETEHDVWEVTL